jgi:uncharacterized protein (DUF1501 family)
VNENLSRGTDHGKATPMYIVGKKVKGGFYGKPVVSRTLTTAISR